MDRSAKYLKRLVGAPGFEPGASCAQGRRATRLRYAPTVDTVLILLHLWFPFQVAITTAVPELCQIALDWSTVPELNLRWPANGSNELRPGSTTRLSRARRTAEAVGIQHVLQCKYSFKFMDVGTADHRQNVELCRAHSFQREI